MSDSQILIVDDERPNLAILCKYLEGESYVTNTVERGEHAWEVLEKNPYQYDTVILDRRLPDISGMEIFKRMQTHSILCKVPVIFQTAMDRQEEILEGLQAGVHYYLTKPFNQQTFLSVLKTIVHHYQNYKTISQELNQICQTLASLQSKSFQFQTIGEAQQLAMILSSICPNPQKVMIGLVELMINAIEHGNLGITYEEKTDLLDSNLWSVEVNRRIRLKENKNKYAVVTYQKKDDYIEFDIQDQGNGFAWKNYLESSSQRASHTHGRGIWMAKTLSFDSLEYIDPGNRVITHIHLLS